jgi:hypothetical protein
MRKILLLTALCFCWLGQSRSHGQNTFAPLGAEWWYYSDDNVFFDVLYSLVHAKVTGDTLLEGKTCQVIQQERITKYATKFTPTSPWLITGADTTPAPPIYVYDTQDTVFIYNTFFHKFTPLYIYNVSVGQTLCLPTIPDLGGQVGSPLSSLGDSTFCFMIDSIATVLYDTSYLETFYTHSLSFIDGEAPPGVMITKNWSYADEDATGIYARTLGGIRGGIVPKGQYENATVDQADPTGRVRLNCYSDNLLRIKVSATACDSLPASTTSVNPLSLSGTGVRIYPNPGSGIFTLSLQKPLKETLSLQIADLSGRCIATMYLAPGKTILKADISSCTPGMYFVLLQSGNQKYYHKLVIRR